MLYAIFSVLLSFVCFLSENLGVGAGVGVGAWFYCLTWFWNLFLIGVAAGSSVLLSIPIVDLTGDYPILETDLLGTLGCGSYFFGEMFILDCSSTFFWEIDFSLLAVYLPRGEYLLGPTLYWPSTFMYFVVEFKYVYPVIFIAFF